MDKSAPTKDTARTVGNRLQKFFRYADVKPRLSLKQLERIEAITKEVEKKEHETGEARKAERAKEEAPVLAKAKKENDAKGFDEVSVAKRGSTVAGKKVARKGSPLDKKPPVTQEGKDKPEPKKPAPAKPRTRSRKLLNRES